MQDVELDGVSYPTVTRIAPNKMLELAVDHDGFQNEFPGSDYSKVQATARHLRTNQVTWFEQEMNGATMYMYEVV